MTTTTTPTAASAESKGITARQFFGDADALRRASLGAAWAAVVRYRSQPGKPEIDPQPADIEDIASDARVRAVTRIARNGWRDDPDKTARAALSYGATFAVRQYVTGLALQGMSSDDAEPSYSQRFSEGEAEELPLDCYFASAESAETARAVLAADSVAPADVGRELGIERQAARHRLIRLQRESVGLGQRVVATVVCSALAELLEG